MGMMWAMAMHKFAMMMGDDDKRAAPSRHDDERRWRGVGTTTALKVPREKPRGSVKASGPKNNRQKG